MTPAILWFRRNLRTIDNASFIAAAECGQPVIPIYISDALDTGGASNWWLHHSLVNLDRALCELGSKLVIRSGRPESVLRELVEKTGATSLCYTRRFEPEARRQEHEIAAELGETVDIMPFDDSLLHDPDRLLSKSQTPYKVFTPFWRSASSQAEPARPRPVPASIEFARQPVDSLAIDDLDLLPGTPDWTQGLRDSWMPGQDGALVRLDSLEDAVRDYAAQRDRPDLDTTSRLSPHLCFGEISARQAWHAINDIGLRIGASSGAAALLRQLYWRDFSSYLLFHFPHLPSRPLKEEFSRFPWSDDQEKLRAWQRGKTGFPMVDAGMRQLWSTGWMHNRVRMLVASFLVKELLIPWQRGADWFLDTLVDADVANNSAGWQWVAGCGTDSAPYFRIFNPVLQGKKFDPKGDYVRRWVPELRGLPDDLVHEPWLADAAVQESSGVIVGSDYPAPIVDRQLARAKALEAYQSIRAGGRLKDTA